jgi:hypothetical protein
MEWIDTPESSNIAGFGYDEESRVLSIEFKNGGRYNYYDVPCPVFDEMKRAPSKGRFHAHHIRNAYRYARS